MKNIKVLLTAFALVAGFWSQASAQRKSFNYWSVAPSVGMFTYQGDLDDNGLEPWISLVDKGNKFGNPIKLVRPAFGFNANYHFHPHLYVSGGLSFGWIGASDRNVKYNEKAENRFRRFRNLDFQSHLFNFELTLVYEFLASDRHYRFRPNWSPYVFAGGAVFNYRPYTSLRTEDLFWHGQNPGDPFYGKKVGEKVYLKELGTEGQNIPGYKNPEGKAVKAYPLTQFSIPIGIGIRRKLTDKIDLRFQICVHKTFTDYLDDVSSLYYADPALLRQYGGFMSEYMADRSGYTGGMSMADTENPLETPVGVAYYGSRGGNGRNWKSAYDVQQAMLAANQPIAPDKGEKRGIPTQKDWYAYTCFTVSFIIDKGDRCPKFK